MCSVVEEAREDGEEEEDDDSLSMGPLSENEVEDNENDPIISMYSYEDGERDEEDAGGIDEDRLAQELHTYTCVVVCV